MSRLTKSFFLFVFSGAITIVVIAICYWCAEHIFFDKFFYRKSLSHGYWTFQNGDSQNLKNFGKRGKDILALIEQAQQPSTTKVLGAEDSEDYIIAIFGDSYSWGLGVKEDQRFSDLMEQSLDKIRPTTVLNFSQEGENLVDNWHKFQLVQQSGSKIDLFIFPIVHNDALLKPSSLYVNTPEDFMKICTGEEIFDFTEETEINSSAEEYQKKIENSLKMGTKNRCVIDHLLKILPKEKTLYVDLDSLLTTDSNTIALGKIFAENGFPILVFHPASADLSSEQEKFFVSKKERHPSALAHQVYAQEITSLLLSEQRFGFTP